MGGVLFIFPLLLGVCSALRSSVRLLAPRHGLGARCRVLAEPLSNLVRCRCSAAWRDARGGNGGKRRNAMGETGGREEAAGVSAASPSAAPELYRGVLCSG